MWSLFCFCNVVVDDVVLVDNVVVVSCMFINRVAAHLLSCFVDFLLSVVVVVLAVVIAVVTRAVKLMH